MPVIEIQLAEPHPGQQQVLDNAARFNVVECGRRWGKSALGITLATLTAIEGKPVGWFAPTFKYVTEIWREAEKILKPLRPKINVQERRIELPTGGVWEFWSLDQPDAGRSRKYKRVIIDEAGIVRGLERAWNEDIRPTLVDLKGDAWFLGTPKGSGHDFHRLFSRGQDGGDPDWKSWRLPTTSNPYIDPAEVEAARRHMPPAAFAQEFEGIPADDGGNPFGLSAIRKCIGPMSVGPPVAIGVDLAKSQDWTVTCGLDTAGCVCLLERWQSDWGQTRRRLLDLIGDTPALFDSTGVGDPILEDIARERFTAEGFKFTATSKQQIMEGLAAAIQRREVAFPDGWLANELESFEYEYRPGGGVRYSAPSGLTDDGVCALALAVEKLARTRHSRADVDSGGYVLTSRRP